MKIGILISGRGSNMAVLADVVGRADTPNLEVTIGIKLESKIIPNNETWLVRSLSDH